MQATTAIGNKRIIKNVFIMSRPPFHIVGILPFVLGAVLASNIFSVFNLGIFLTGFFAVIAIMLVTYYNGEYYDILEDKLSAKLEKNTFSGGSQIIAQEQLPKKYAKIASYIALVITAILGLLCQFYFKTGKYTLILGIIGLFFGYFYSHPPIRFASRGIGEILIGFCYGWLPVTAGFYLQTGHFNNLANWVSVPIGFTIFNVILINEFPDYKADKEYNKKNLVVRLGKEKAGIIYIISVILTWVFFGISIYKGIPLISLYCYLPFFFVSVFIIFSIIKKAYNDYKKLEKLCALTLIINIGVTLSYIIGVAFGI